MDGDIYIVFEIFKNSVKRGWIYIVFDMLLTVFRKLLFGSLHSKALFSTSQDIKLNQKYNNKSIITRAIMRFFLAGAAAPEKL